MKKYEYTYQWRFCDEDAWQISLPIHSSFAAAKEARNVFACKYPKAESRLVRRPQPEWVVIKKGPAK